MDSAENMRPAVETLAPDAPSSYQLAPRTDNSTLLIGPPGFSPPMGGGSLVKKKRGRPRKYGPDGVVAGSVGETGRTLSPIPISAAGPPISGGYSEIKFGDSEGSGGSLFGEKKKVKMSSVETKSKHGYGCMDLGDRIASGGSFTPHMVTVNPGQGRFEILSLSGSFTPGEFGGLSSCETKMSITLSSPDGRVVGGQLGGVLTAAGPVQVHRLFYFLIVHDHTLVQFTFVFSLLTAAD
ncbi:putative AT-hook motif nuclear-localized protein [Helianthus annuus]|nr:putative AT-hook motif nuclear-localized protein [Helianthus annuus]